MKMIKILQKNELDLSVGKLYLKVIKNWNDLLPNSNYDENDISNYDILKSGLLIAMRNEKKVILQFSFNRKGEIYQWSDVKEEDLCGKYIESTIDKERINRKDYALRDLKFFEPSMTLEKLYKELEKVKDEYMYLNDKSKYHYIQETNENKIEIRSCLNNYEYNKYYSSQEIVLDNYFIEVILKGARIARNTGNRCFKVIEQGYLKNGKMYQHVGDLPRSLAVKVDTKREIHYKLILEK